MSDSLVNDKGKVNSAASTAPEAIEDEITQLCSDFLLRTWLLVDKMLPEQLSKIRDVPKAALANHEGYQGPGKDTSYSNFMLFLCVAATLNEHGSLTMGNLSRHISVPYSTATRMVDWMVDSGYAQRAPDPEDRRIVRVALTAEGKKLSHEAKGFLYEHAVASLKRLPEIQRKTLLINMKEVINAWASVLKDLE